MEEIHGSKLRLKVASLWRRIVRSRYSRLKPEDSSYEGLSASESNANPNPSSNCFCFRMPYRHTKRRLCRRMSFPETRKEVKGKIFKGWMQKNGCNNKNGKEFPKDVPKGFVAVCVGDTEEEQTRFVIPIRYLNHPLFLRLFDEAEAVYGFSQKGVFSIPCQVSDFEYLQWLIEREHNFKR